MSHAVILSATRTAVGTFGGSLKNIAAKDLGAITIKAALEQCGLKPAQPADAARNTPRPLTGKDCQLAQHAWDPVLTDLAIDEVIMGNVLTAGQGQNPARQASVMAGLPMETPAFTVSKVCASGMKAVTLAAQTITAGDADFMIAGGMENMSMVPYALPKARWGYRMDMPHGELTDLMVFDGLYETFYGYHMGITAENIAQAYAISREEQDQLGLESHNRALKAIESGILKDEIVPVPIPQRRGDPLSFDTDERPMQTSIEKMASLKAVFRKDGTVTAGNASGINDAAAALLMANEDLARERGLKPLARIKGFASGGLDPAYMGLGPVPAVRRLLQKTGTTIADYGLIELNEAFASQAIACMRELDMDPATTNVNGSGISIGHPIGCTGARIIVALVHEMKRRQVELGLASLCIGGGMGMAIAIENL